MMEVRVSYDGRVSHPDPTIACRSPALVVIDEEDDEDVSGGGGTVARIGRLSSL